MPTAMTRRQRRPESLFRTCARETESPSLPSAILLSMIVSVSTSALSSHSLGCAAHPNFPCFISSSNIRQSLLPRGPYSSLYESSSLPKDLLARWPPSPISDPYMTKSSSSALRLSQLPISSIQPSSRTAPSLAPSQTFVCNQLQCPPRSSWIRSSLLSPLRRFVPRRTSLFSLHMVSKNDEDGSHDDDIFGNAPNNDEEEEDSEYDEVKSKLDKISWLPSVLLGRQPSYPYNESFESRKENFAKDSYESLEGNSSNPPGYHNIEILPVLPINMVHGLDGLLMDNNQLADDIIGANHGADSDHFGYGSGVWEDEYSSLASSLGPIFSGTSGYLPHTKGHVFTVAEPRYKKLYDDLLRMGSYYGKKRERALKALKENMGGDIPSLPDPDKKRRFIVTAASPREDGVFAQYGVLFQLRDLDTVAAINPAELGEGVTLGNFHQLVEAAEQGLEVDDDDMEDIMEALLKTHYEATHDVVGRVKIHRFINPECWGDDPNEEDYLIAEATILDIVENDRSKMLEQQKKKKLQVQKESTEDKLTGEALQDAMSTMSALDKKTQLNAYGDVARAVARIKDELQSEVSEIFSQQQQQIDPDRLKEKLRSALDEAHSLSPNSNNIPGENYIDPPPPPQSLAPKGILVERRSDDSLTVEERALRESFAQLVSLQHELREECRFTRVSVQTFGIGPVGIWLSAAAWSQYVEKRLDSSHSDMQTELQAKLVEYLAEENGEDGDDSVENQYHVEEGVVNTVDFEDLSPELQQEFQLVQARAAQELAPLAFEQAIQMQLIVQAESYSERLNLLRECVEAERKRLEAKKMLRTAFGNQSTKTRDATKENPLGNISREEARSVFERLMETDRIEEVPRFEGRDDDAFQ